MNKMVKRSDIETIHKRQQLVSQQRDKRETKESIKDPFDNETVVSEQHASGRGHLPAVPSAPSLSKSALRTSVRKLPEASLRSRAGSRKSVKEIRTIHQDKEYRDIPSLRKMVTLSKNYTKVHTTLKEQTKVGKWIYILIS